MAVSRGTQLDAYETLSPVGAGGGGPKEAMAILARVDRAAGLRSWLETSN